MGRLWDLVSQPVVRRLIGSGVRKGLVALGVWLAARDVDVTGWPAFVEAATPILAAVIWTVVDKVRTEKTIAVALDQPKGTTREELSLAVKERR